MKIRTIVSLLLCLFIMNQTFTKTIESDSFRSWTGEIITVHFIQHASLYITFNGLTIYVDPVKYDGIDYLKLPKADVILVTHDHYDHFCQETIAAISTPNTMIYCNKKVQEVLEKGIAMKNNQQISYKNSSNDKYIIIESVPAYNTTAGRDIYHPKGRDNGYLITLGGTRIYISGDCENIPEMSQLKDIDVAFLSINQPYTMTVTQAIAAAKIIKPSILYPIHYSDTDLKGLSVLKDDEIEVKIFKM